MQFRQQTAENQIPNIRLGAWIWSWEAGRGAGRLDLELGGRMRRWKLGFGPIKFSQPLQVQAAPTPQNKKN